MMKLANCVQQYFFGKHGRTKATFLEHSEPNQILLDPLSSSALSAIVRVNKVSQSGG